MITQEQLERLLRPAPGMTQERLLELLHYDPETGVFTGAVTSYANGYMYISLDDRKYRAHRLAFLYQEGAIPPGSVYHINGVHDDNRWCNLSTTPPAGRLGARRRYSGHWGVNRGPEDGWWAEIWVEGRRIPLGHFHELDEAIAARKAAESEYQGRFTL